MKTIKWNGYTVRGFGQDEDGQLDYIEVIDSNGKNIFPELDHETRSEINTQLVLRG